MVRAVWLILLLAAQPTASAAQFMREVRDEAMRAERSAESFLPADENYFAAMDNGLELTPDEVKGRNMWMVWTGGNDLFWDRITYTGGIGHNLPQEAPQAFAEAVVDIAES